MAEVSRDLSSSSRWVRAEDVDWFLLARRLQTDTEDNVKRIKSEELAPENEEKREEGEACSIRSLDDLTKITSLLESSPQNKAQAMRVCASAVQFLDDHLRGMVNVPRETVAACVRFTKAGQPYTLEFFLMPLLQKEPIMYELVERVLVEADGQMDNDFLELAAKEKATLVRDDDTLLFWQRTFFGRRLSENMICKIVMDLDHIPTGSKRVAGAIMALVKGNSDAIAPYAQALQNVVSRGTGVLVAPARKALQNLSVKTTGAG